MFAADDVNGCVLLGKLLGTCAQATRRAQDVINHHDKDGYPPLAYAIASSSKGAVQLLLERKANPNAMAHGFPLLAYAIVSEADWIVQLLLSYGADPSSVPAQLFMNVQTSVGGQQAAREAQLSEEQRSNPTMSDRDLQLLASSLNLAMKYWLYQATRLPPLTEAQQRVLAFLSLQRLPTLFLMLVGQEAALTAVFSAVAAHLVISPFVSPAGTGSKKKPLTLLFAGPPGHGKTLLAEELGRVVSAPGLFIDCATTGHMSDMFGCQKPYQGNQQGSTLVNFLSVNEGKRCVVVLDELEKAEEEVRDGLGAVFDGGQVLDWRDGTRKLVDCSQAIFVMTTNAHDCVKPSLASQIAYTVPFIPFNEAEAAVLVSRTLGKLRKSLSRTASEPDKPGGLKVEIQEEGEVCRKLATETFSPNEGALALENAVWVRVHQQVSRMWMDEDLHPGSRLTINPDSLDNYSG